MLYFTLLCLAGSVLAQPTVYLSRSGIEYPWSFYNPPVVADLAANVPGIPEAPLLEPLSLVRTVSLEDPENRKVDVIVTEEKKEDETEGKPEEEIKEERPKEEEEKSEGMNEEKIEKIVIARRMPGKPMLVKFNLSQIPEWANNFWSNLPISIPFVNMPFSFPPLFGKPPPSPSTQSEPLPVVETIPYIDPSFISAPYVRVVSAK